MSKAEAEIYAKHLELYMNGTHGQPTSHVVSQLLTLLKGIANDSGE